MEKIKCPRIECPYNKGFCTFSEETTDLNRQNNWEYLRDAFLIHGCRKPELVRLASRAIIGRRC